MWGNSMQVVVVEEDGEAKGVLCLEIGSMIRFQNPLKITDKHVKK